MANREGNLKEILENEALIDELSEDELEKVSAGSAIILSELGTSVAGVVLDKMAKNKKKGPKIDP